MATVRRVPGPAAAPLKAALAGIDGKVGKVGWFKTAQYPGGVPVALVAAVNEYGWPEHNIPPRLGMRATAERCEPKWASVALGAARKVIAGKMASADAMELIGLKAAADIRKNIASVVSPPLKVNTVKARLSGKKQGRVVSITAAKPLVHTGHLLNTLTNTVENG